MVAIENVERNKGIIANHDGSGFAEASEIKGEKENGPS